MGSDCISDLQGVHQHSLEWPGGENAPMHPPVTAPGGLAIKKEPLIPFFSKTKVPTAQNR